jgi:hypothetical protein
MDFRYKKFVGPMGRSHQNLAAAGVRRLDRRQHQNAMHRSIHIRFLKKVSAA